MHDDDITTENIAQTLARELPQATILATNDASSANKVLHVAVPDGHKLQEVDLERLLPNPRRCKSTATFTDADSFIGYINRHNNGAAVVWCQFDPQALALSFVGVLDDHRSAEPGWRSHLAKYTPSPSHEWKVWVGANLKHQEQIEFAEFIERHEPDVSTQEGYPTSLQMLAMATEFEANSDKRVKSVVRLQGGGVRLDYVDDDNDATLTQMKAFDKFQIGIPVFWAGPAYRIDARLKYRHGSGKVKFWYELIRPDRVHEAAARELIAKVRAEVGSEERPVPMFMGQC
jgi:uncharacterized protein YfdQ (DUF2303 family)